MGDGALIAAVRSGDVAAVDALLDAGADPDTVDGAGTPALCLAVDAFDLPVVELLSGAARLDRVAPDGRTALLRAVDRGAYEITEALVCRGAQLWHKDGAGRDALALARYWHETGAVDELRRRSGRTGRTGGTGRSGPAEPVRRRTVRGAFGTTCEELSLGGRRVRTGHTAILTVLEPRYGVRPAFEELLSRALAEPDVDHEVWWATTSAAQQRHDPAVREAAAALRDRPDARERYFGAEVLRLIDLFEGSDSEEGDFAGSDVEGA
ncbi:ankyrin repeat domain-containing protein [Streptomyces endophytica]|uniref:Ankyrin repeat domain-containing protein n=1 Tax=Streptomyces endophytica TaxID=2991496 RepID=A0ABY6P653_9ACTN|nr:ankyrin repeat domain-containing protein [Streptomyces endophytica]UZJ29254.1 ankyrin repeat domain-containing protein [Streptomyces endophytica]